MLAKCVNHSCPTRFRYLEEGRLFRLERDRLVGPLNREKVEYFWLCATCSRTMTLRLDDHMGVTVAPLRKSAQHAADHAKFVLLDRQRGLTLASLVGALFFTRAS